MRIQDRHGRRWAAAFGVFGLMGLACLSGVNALAADEKNTAPNPPPSVLITSPLAAIAGATNTIRLRGLGLTNVTEVRFLQPPEGIGVEIVSKTKSDPPKPLDAKRAGDTQIELSVRLPASVAATALPYLLVSHHGVSPTNMLSVLSAETVVDDKDPNGGFKNAQHVTPGQTVRGEIGREKDVDVFRLTGKAGDKIRVEIIAASLGSPLDAMLNFYDAGGHLLAASDDPADGKDPVLEVRLPAGGEGFLAVFDAHDRGGAAHGYLLKTTGMD